MEIVDNNNIPTIIEELQKLKELAIEIGVFGSDDSYMAMIATVNEFGAEIRPKGKYLTIPTKWAKGRKASDIDGLYRPFGKDRKPINLLVIDGGPEVNEYGNTVMFYLSEGVTIPERSFIRSTFDEKEKDWAEYIAKLIGDLIHGSENARSVAEKIGARIQRDIQRTIREMSAPSNATVTVARKGANNPLIDSGRLRQSITYKVV